MPTDCGALMIASDAGTAWEKPQAVPTTAIRPPAAHSAPARRRYAGSATVVISTVSSLVPVLMS